MDKIFACIDGQTNTQAVIDWSAWAALRLDAPLEFLHVLERHPERSSTQDFSGAIGLGAQESLLQGLSESDALQSKSAIEAGRLLLEKARERAADAGVKQLDGRLRHGELLSTVQEMENGATLFVLGEHYHANRAGKVHFDHRVEQVIRSVKRSVLIATNEKFVAPKRFAVAFDGSAKASQTIDSIKASALTAGMTALIVMVGVDSTLRLRQLDEAKRSLVEKGYEVYTHLLRGEPNEVIPLFVKQHEAQVLVMGAFGHSWLRQLISGSTTSTLLRVIEVPVLVLR